MTFRRVLMILMVFAGIGLSAQTFAINPYDLLGQWQMERTNLSIKYNDQIITDVWEERNDNLKCEFTKNGVYRNSEGDVGRFILKGDELTLIYPEIGEQVEYQILELDDENLAWACINVMKLTRGELQELPAVERRGRSGNPEIPVGEPTRRGKRRGAARTVTAAGQLRKLRSVRKQPYFTI